MSRLPGNPVDIQTPGLREASKIAELEKRIEDLERKRFEAGSVATTTNIVGGWSTSTPPNGTTGGVFTVPADGTYAMITTATGWGTGIFAGVEYYIDGTYKYFSDMYLNDGTHHALPIGVWAQTLTKGDHYLWIRAISGFQSDTNSRARLIAIRVGP